MDKEKIMKLLSEKKMTLTGLALKLYPELEAKAAYQRLNYMFNSKTIKIEHLQKMQELFNVSSDKILR